MFSYFFLEEKFCVSACVSKSLARMFIVWSVPKTLSRKLYLRLYLTQTVHSNGKILFPLRKNCLLKFLWCGAHILLFLIFFKEKLCVSVHVSKSFVCLDRVYFVSKKSYLSVVFAPWRWDCWSMYPRFYLTEKKKKKTVHFLFNGKILSLLIIFSQLIFCQVPNCKMLVSANILLISLVWRHTCLYCTRIFKIKKTLSHSVASCQAIENNNDLIRKEKTIR